MASSQQLLQPEATGALDDPGVRRKLLLSHTITRTGTQAWMFCAPLVLLRFTPGTIVGPACWGLVTMLASMFFGPPIGTWADKTDRNRVVTLGVAAQAVAVLGSTLALIAVSATEDTSSQSPSDNIPALAAFTFFGVVEKLGTVLSDVAVKREWAPCLFTKGDKLYAVNVLMSQIDLSTEVVGPFGAGLLMSLGVYNGGAISAALLPSSIHAEDFGFIAVGLLNVLSFGPQLSMLRAIYRTHAHRLQPQQKEARKVNLPQSGAWGSWFSHPGGLKLLSLSYSLLYLTVLSPHGALLTAFLLMYGVPTWELSLLRGSGALLGVLGVTFRGPMGKCLGERCADAFSVIWLATAMAIALFAFNATADEESEAVLADTLGLSGADAGRQAALLVFMAAVCLGRPGLYAFELGVLNTEQEIADSQRRTAVGAVDNALTSGATVVMYGTGILLARPEQFGFLVAGSSFFVTLGALVYVCWMCCYKKVRHKHDSGHGGHEAGHSHGHSHESGHVHHPHTTQEVEELMGNPDGLHEHIVYDPSTCGIQ